MTRLPPVSTAQSLTPEEAARYAELAETHLVQFTCDDLDQYLRLKSRALPAARPPQEDVVEFAYKAYRQPYALGALRFSFDAGDCVTFTERALAMGLSRNWEEFYTLSERLRHRDGAVEFENRNFCTLSEWAPHNDWLLQDITEYLTVRGAPVVQYFTFNVRDAVFEYHQLPGSRFTRTVFKGYDFGSPPRAVLNVPYIPKDHVFDILPFLQSGDVCLVIRQYRRPQMKPWFDCDHMGLIVREPDGTVGILHSAPPSARQEDIMEFLRKYTWVAGFRFLRMRADAVAAAEGELVRLGTAIHIPDAQEQDVRNAQLIAERSAP